MSMLDESGEPLQPLVDEESSTLPRFNGSGQSEQSEKSEQHLTTPWFVKLGVAALIAGAAVALWHFSPSLKSLAPGGTLKSYEDSEEWPQWSDGDDEGWDDGDSGVDDGFGLTRHESQTSAYGYASNNGYDEGEGSNASGFSDSWSSNRPQGEEPIPAYGYGDGSGTASFDDGWADAETSAQTTTTTTIHFYPPLPAIRKYINHYKASNPLNIEVKSSRSENYFLILGDWGKAGGPGSCQLAVATRMRAYVKEQKLRGKHLLFIASVGDNFYWTGATPEAWERTWAQPYGVHDPSSPLYQIPWLSLYLGCLNCLRPRFILPCQVRFLSDLLPPPPPPLAASDLNCKFLISGHSRTASSRSQWELLELTQTPDRMPERMSA